jgi:hypothetical protein
LDGLLSVASSTTTSRGCLLSCCFLATCVSLLSPLLTASCDWIVATRRGNSGEDTCANYVVCYYVFLYTKKKKKKKQRKKKEPILKKVK